MTDPIEKLFAISNRMEELGRIRAEIEQLMLGLRFSEECRSDVQLICEEILCNIISYGFPKHEDQSMEMQFVFDGHSLTLEFIDKGIAFDPLDRPDPNLDEPDAEDRPVGGLGIYLVKELTDHQDYARLADTNHLKVRRSISLLKD